MIDTVLIAQIDSLLRAHNNAKICFIYNVSNIFFCFRLFCTVKVCINHVIVIARE